jgi:hydroxymethylpyrimidine/phosphomethylpyrimidine kinase
MGNVVPDRFFWALAPGEEEDGADGDNLTPDASGPRHIH